MLFDSHTHLNLAAFDNDRDILLKKYLEEGIFLLNIGTCFKTSEKAVAIANKYSNCWASVGLHPGHTFPAPLEQLDQNEINNLVVEKFDSRFEDLIAQNKKVVAVGECGLDYSYLKDLPQEERDKAKTLQEQEFIKQIKVAQKYHLPLILHLRDLYQEALKILKENNYQGKAVFHFFTGTLEDLNKILENSNYFIGFSGVITYSNKLDEVIKGVPLERLLVETDAPYVAPIPYRG
ncbi:MAG: TatD family hydrolase, partial [Parcubacteria group bacterium]|nr:TatD family hydrolase [Parcubacteria group bacterium]